MIDHISNANYYCADDDPFVLSMYSLPPGQCGGIANDRRQVDHNSIALVIPTALDKAKCDCIEGTILHEASHNILDTSDISGANNAYDFASGCLPCARHR